MQRTLCRRCGKDVTMYGRESLLEHADDHDQQEFLEQNFIMYDETKPPKEVRKLIKKFA